MTHVLIVEDEAPVRRLLQRWAQTEGTEVVTAESAEEALEVAGASAPAVAFCDYHLPGKDGLWLARQLRLTQPDTAVVMATAVMDSEVAMSGLNAGAIDYLIKPFTRERMSEALRWALFTHGSRQAFARMTETQTELDRIAASNVSAVLAIIRLHNPTMHDHARRVARLAGALAFALDVRQPELCGIDMAALLHDLARDPRPEIGKDAAVDWQPILQLPSLRGPLALASAVHQPYDPDQRDVPFAARIIAVAEAHDELVSGMFGPAETPSHATEILCTERVMEFDPAVLGALRTLDADSAVA